MDQTRELFESPPAECWSSGAGNGTSDGRELLEWEFDGYVSRAGESWVDPLEFLIDDPTFGFGKPLLPLSLVDDRRHGRNRPIFQTEAQLAMIRGAARIVAQTAPMAIGALEALGNYVIGKGFTYEVADRPFRAGRQAPDGLAACVQDVIDEFCDVNDWVGDRERELHNRVRRDGEAFTALYPDKNGIARTRFIEPERVTCSAGGEEGLEKAQQHLKESTDDLADAQNEAIETLDNFMASLQEFATESDKAVAAQKQLEKTRSEKESYSNPNDPRPGEKPRDSTSPHRQVQPAPDNDAVRPDVFLAVPLLYQRKAVRHASTLRRPGEGCDAAVACLDGRRSATAYVHGRRREFD